MFGRTQGHAGSIRDLFALTRQRDLAVLAALMTATSLTEGIGVLALAPILASFDRVRHLPGILGRLVDASGITPTIGGLLTVTLALAIARTILVHAQTMAMSRTRNELVDRLRVAAFAGVIRADWRWLAQSRASDVGNLILTNVNHIGFGLTSVLALASAAIGGIVYLCASLILSWKLALAAFISGGTVLVMFAGQRRRALALGVALGGTRAAFHSFVHQGLAGVRLIKAFGTEDARIADLDRAAETIRGQMDRQERMSSLGRGALQAGGLIVLTGIVYIGVAVVHVALSLLLPLLFVFARLLPLLGSIQQNWSSWNHVRPALIETQRLLADTAAFQELPADPAHVPLALREALILDQVTVTYAERGVPALDAVSLSLAANTTTVLYGPSGAGKSTLADIVMGLIACDAGRLMVDNREIAGNDRVHWRRSIAYVQQDAFVFHTTIRANLLLDRQGIGEGEIDEAIARAGAGFVYRLPEGIDTIVGDGGVRLSGGERQRIALARALIGRPALLVLDEATSALDPDNELAVRRTMAALRGTTTMLLISHRTSMQEDADQVVEVSEGRLRVVLPYSTTLRNAAVCDRHECTDRSDVSVSHDESAK
ncbi:ABC transporter ATP-binding protein [Sphingomonas sp. M1A8_2b]